MWISLASIRQFLMGSAGMGSLLVVGLPGVWADSPRFPNETLPSAPIHAPSPTPVETRDSVPWERKSPRSYSPPQAARLMQPALAVLPPPGTLAQTYLRQSWPIPKDEHPRTAIIQVNAPGFSELQMEGLLDMEGFQRPDGAWIFKSKEALIPGVPHIYHVKAGHKNADNTRWDVRTVRLIPGRMVTLEY